MDSPEEQVPATIPAAHFSLPYFRLLGAVGVTAAVLAVLIAWGGDWGRPPTLSSSGLHPTFRYVDSGWISPEDWQESGPFTDELRAFVIVSQEELDSFESGFISKVNRGNATTLGRINFETSVLLAAYYLWRPVKGDPLSVMDVIIKGDRSTVLLDLDDDAQGREFAYLYAPMVMVAVERSLFPKDEAVEFIFELADHPPIALTATPNR